MSAIELWPLTLPTGGRGWWVRWEVAGWLSSEARWYGWDFKVLAASEQLAEKLVLVRIKSQIIEAYAIIHFEVECARTHTMIQEHGPGSLYV